MTAYTKTMAQALQEVYIEENNMAKMKKAASGSMQTLKMKDGNLQMDKVTASAIMAVYNAVNPKNKKTMENMLSTGKKSDIMKLQKFALSKTKMTNASYNMEEFEEVQEAMVNTNSVSMLDLMDLFDKAMSAKPGSDEQAKWKGQIRKLKKSMGVKEEVDLDEIDMNMVAFATFGFGAMVVLPGIIALDMLNSHTDGGVDRTLEKIINGLKSKLKKDKNYKPSSTEIDASKKLEKQIKKDEPSLYKKAMAKVKSISSKIKKEDLDEGTWAMPDSSKKLKGLMQVLKRPIPLGKGGDSAVSVIRDFIGDDELYDDLGDAGDKNPKGDARPIIMKAMKRLKITQKNAEVEMDEGTMNDVIVMRKGRVSVSVIANAANVKKKEKEGFKIDGVIEKGSSLLHKEPKRIMKAIKGGDKLNIGETVEYVEYRFRNKNDAMAAKKMLDAVQMMNFEINDDNISGGELMVDSGSKDMTKYHKEVMKKFRPKVMTQEKVDIDEHNNGTDHDHPHDDEEEDRQQTEASPIDRLMKFDKSRTAAGKKPIFTKDKNGGKMHKMKKKGSMITMNVPSNEVEKYKKMGYSEEVEEGAAADARKAIGRDKDLGKKRDSADDDDDASDDDVKGASKNIIMQLRKAGNRASMGVEFGDGKKQKVPPQIAQKVQSKYNSFRRPAEKQEFQSKISKSYRDMLKAIKEENEPVKESILTRIDNKLMERKNG